MTTPLPPLSLAWPLAHPRLTSGFGQRVDPITKKPGAVHQGLDFGVPAGTPLLAAADGVVVAAGLGVAGQNPDRSYGLRIVIEHADGWQTTSNHLSEVTVATGDHVKAGQVIGATGGIPGDPRSGRTTGPHLHFEVRRENPRTFFDPQCFLPGGRGPEHAARWCFGASGIVRPA